VTRSISAPRRAPHALTILFLLFLAACAAPRPAAPPARPEEGAKLPEPPLVRVALLVGASEVQVGSTENFALSDDQGTLVIGSSVEVFSVRRDGGRAVVQTQSGELVDTAEGALRLEAQSTDGLVTVNGARYPGMLVIVPAAAGGLHVINVVDVETYLRGVVPLEIGIKGNGELEAAKAQAIAARTYVAGHLGQYVKEKFDLYAGVTDQVYGPVDRRHPDADAAVAETRGLILLYKDRPIRANYASTCGGTTAGAEESFPVSPIPYLVSHEDRLGGEIACRTSRVFRWEESWTGDELLQVFSRTVPRVLGKPWKGTVVRLVEALETGKSGRVVKLRILSDQEGYIAEKGAIREILESANGKPLRSTDFDIELFRRGDQVRRMVVQGRGWGHGVGMCQWGAMQLSREGVEFRRILQHYYPGTDLKPWYPSRPLDRTARGGSPAHG
jgi:stage II sporulation protein D